MTDAIIAPTDRTRLRRKADRGRHDFGTIAAILDEGLVCHLGFAVDGRPWVVPTAYARIGEHLFVHGATGNFALRSVVAGAEACVTVTLLDAIVLARSAFHHSVNYRSVMLFARGEAVTDADEKRTATLAIVDHLVPGRSDDTRSPTDAELRATLVVRFPIDEASAKIRSSAPVEEESDVGLPHWAGVLPLSTVSGHPVHDLQASGDATLPLPEYVQTWRRGGRG